MNGKIIANVSIYYLNGGLAWGAQVDDVVIGEGGASNIIYTLSRRGVEKLNGTYRIATTSAVQWDTVTPPSDPPPAGPTLVHTIEVYSNGSLVIDGIAYP